MTTDADASRLARQRAQLLLHFAQHLQDEKPPDVRGVLGVVEASDIQLPEHLQLLLCAAWVRRRLQYGILDTGVATLLAGLVPLTEESAQLHVDVRTEACLQLLDAKPVDWGEFDLTVTALFRQPAPPGAQDSGDGGGSGRAAGVGEPQQPQLVAGPGQVGPRGGAAGSDQSKAAASGEGHWSPVVAQMFADRQQQLRLCSRSSGQGLDRKLAQALELLTQEGQREGVLQAVDAAVTVAEECLGVINTAFIKQFQAVTVATLPSPTIQPQQQKAQQQDRDQRGEQSAAEPEPPPPRHDASPLPAAASSLPSRPVLQQQQPRQGEGADLASRHTAATSATEAGPGVTGSMAHEAPAAAVLQRPQRQASAAAAATSCGTVPQQHAPAPGDRSTRLAAAAEEGAVAAHFIAPALSAPSTTASPAVSGTGLGHTQATSPRPMPSGEVPWHDPTAAAGLSIAAGTTRSGLTSAVASGPAPQALQRRSPQPAHGSADGSPGLLQAHQRGSLGPAAGGPAASSASGRAAVGQSVQFVHMWSKTGAAGRSGLLSGMNNSVSSSAAPQLQRRQGEAPRLGAAHASPGLPASEGALAASALPRRAISTSPRDGLTSAAAMSGGTPSSSPLQNLPKSAPARAASLPPLASSLPALPPSRLAAGSRPPAHVMQRTSLAEPAAHVAALLGAPAPPHAQLAAPAPGALPSSSEVIGGRLGQIALQQRNAAAAAAAAAASAAAAAAAATGTAASLGPSATTPVANRYAPTASGSAIPAAAPKACVVGAQPTAATAPSTAANAAVPKVEPQHAESLRQTAPAPTGAADLHAQAPAPIAAAAAEPAPLDPAERENQAPAQESTAAASAEAPPLHSPTAAPVQSPDVAFRAEAEALALPDAGTSLGERSVAAAAADLAAVVAATEVGSGSRQAAAVSKETSADASAAGAAEPVAGEERSAPQQRISADSVISLRGAEVHGSGGGDAARAPARALAVCEPPPAAEPPPPNQPSMSLLAWPPQRPSPPRQLLQPPPAPSQPSQPSPPRSPPATVPDPDAMEAERAVLEGGSAQALGDGGGPSQASPAPLELVLPLSGAAEAQLQDEESGAVAPSAVTAAGVPEQARPVADAAANNTKSDVHVATAAPTLVGSDTAMEAIALVPEQPTSVAAKANTAGGAVLANAPPAALLLAPASPQPLTTAAVTLLHYGTTPPTPLLATAAAGEVELRVGDVAAAAEPIADTSALTAAGPEAAAAAAAAVGTEAAEAAGPEAAAAEAAVAEPAVAEPAVAEAAVAEAAVAETAAAEAAAAEAASQPPGPGLLTQQVAPVGAGAAATPGPATDGGGLPPAMHAAATAYQPTSPFAAGTEQAVAAPTPYQPATSPASEAEIMTPPDAGAAAARVDALLGLILPATGPSASGPYQAIGSPHAAGLYTWLGQAQQAVAGSTAQEPDEQQQHQHQHQQPEQHHQVQRSTTPGAGSLAQLLVAVSAGSEATASTRTATAAEVAVEAAVEDTLSPLPLLAQAQSRLAQQQEAEGQEAEGHEAEGNAGVERNAPSEPAEPIVPMEAAAGLQSAAATWGTGSAHGEPFSAAEDSRQPRDQQSADSGGAPLLPGGGGAGEPMAQPKAPLAAAARSEQPHARRDGGSLEDRMLTDAATEAAEVAGSLAAPSAGAAGAAAAAGAGGGRSCSAEPVTPRDPRQLAAGGQGLGGDAHANSAMEANPAQTGASPWGSDVASPPLQPQRTPFPGAVADVPAEAQLEAVPVAMDGASLQALAEAAPGLGSEAVLPAVVRGLALLQLLPTGLEEQVSAAVSAAVSATAAAAQQAAGHAGGVVATAALSSAADAATFCGSAVQPQVEEGVCAKAARSARPQDAVAHMPATDASLQEDCRQGSMDPELDGQPAHPQQAQEGQQRKPDEQQDEQQGHEQQAQKRTPLDALATDSHDGQQQDDSTLTECTARAVRPHAPCSSGSSAQSQGAHQPALQQERSQTQHGAAVSQHASEEDQLLQQDGRQALQAGAHQVTAPTPQEQEPLVQQAGVSALDDESQRGGQPQRTAETAVATGGAAAAEAAVRRIPLDTSTEPGEQLDPVPQRPMPPMPPQPQVFGDVGDAAAALAAGAAVTEVTAVTRAVIFTGAQAGERVASTDAAALLQALEQRPSRPPAAVEDDGRVATQQAGWPQAGSADRSSALGAPAAAPQLPVHQQRSTVLSRVRIQPKSTTGAAPSRLSPDSAPSAQVQAAAPLRPQPVLPAGAAHLGSMRPDGAGLLRTGAVAVPLVAGHPAAPSSAAVADGLQASSQGRQARRIPPSFLANRRSTHSTQQQTGAPGMLATGSGQREPPATAAERQVQGKHGCEQEPGSRSRDQVTAAPASQQPPPAAREAAAQSQLLSAAPAVGRRLVSRGQPDSGAVGTAPQEQPLRAAAEAAAGTPAATQPAVQREASLVVPAAGVKRRRTCLPGGAPPHAAAAAAGARHAPPQESQQQAQQQGTAPSRPRRQQPARVPSSTAQSGLPPFAAVEADDVPYDSAILRQCLDILREPPPDGQDHMPVADIPRWVLDSRCSMLLRRTGDPELVARSAAALLLLHAMINQTPSLPRQQRQLGRQAKGSGSGVGKPAAATAGAEQADCAKIELLQTQRYYVVSPKESEVKLWQEAWEERQRGAQVPAAAAAVPVAAPAAMPPQQPGSTAAGAAQVETIDMTAVPDSPSPARFKSAEGARVCAAIHRAQLQMQSPQRQPPATALHQDLPHEVTSGGPASLSEAALRQQQSPGGTSCSLTGSERHRRWLRRQAGSAELLAEPMHRPTQHRRSGGDESPGAQHPAAEGTGVSGEAQNRSSTIAAAGAAAGRSPATKRARPGVEPGRHAVGAAVADEAVTSLEGAPPAAPPAPGGAGLAPGSAPGPAAAATPAQQAPEWSPPRDPRRRPPSAQRLRTPIPPAAAVTAATPRMQVPAFLAPGVVVSGAASAARTHTDTDIQLPRRRRVRPPSIGPEPGDEEAQRLRLRAEAAAAAENAAKAAAGPAGGSPGGSAARASGSGGGARGAAAAPRSTPSKSPLARLARALAEALPELVELESEPQPAAAAAAGATGAGAATAGAGAHPGQQPEAVAAVDGSSSAEAAGAAENDLRDAALATHAMDASPAAGPQAGAAAGVFQRAGQNGAAAAIRGDGSPGGEAPDSAISVRIDELLHLRALQHRDQVRNLFQSLLGRTPGTPVGPSSQPVPAGAAAISGDPDPGAGAVPAGGAVAAPSLVARAADVPGPVAAAVSNRTPSAAVAASTQQPQPQPEQGPAAQQVSGAGRTRQHQGPQTAAERPTPETVDLNRHLRHVYAGETPFADAVPVQLLERLLRQLDPGRPEPGSPQPPQQQPPPARDTHLPDEQSDAVQLGAGPESAGLDARGRSVLLRTLPKTLFDTTAAGAAQQGAASAPPVPEARRTAAVPQPAPSQPTAAGVATHSRGVPTACAQQPYAPRGPAAGALHQAARSAAAHDAIDAVQRVVSSAGSSVSPEEFFADAPVVPSLLPGLGLDGALKLLRQQQELERQRATLPTSPRAAAGGGASAEATAAAAAAPMHAAPGQALQQQSQRQPGMGPSPIHLQPQQGTVEPLAAATASPQRQGATAQERTAGPATTTSATTFSFGDTLKAGGYRLAGDANSAGAESESLGGEPLRAHFGDVRQMRPDGGITAASAIPVSAAGPKERGDADGSREQPARSHHSNCGAGATTSEAGPAFSLAGWQQPSASQRAAAGRACERAPGNSASAGGGDGTAGAGGDGADGALPVASQPGAGSRSAAGSGGAAVSQHHHDSLGAAGGGSVGAAATASAGTAAHGGELGEPVAEALQLLLQTLLFAQAERQQQPGQPRRQQQGAEPLDLNLLSSGLQQLLQQAAPAGGAGARTSSAGLPGQAGAGERLGMGQLPEQMAVRTTGAYRGQSQQQPAPADVWPATGQQQQQVHYAYAPPPPQQQPQQPAPMPPAAPRYGAAVPPSGYVHHTAAHQPPPGGQVPQRYAAPHGYDAVQQAYGAPGYAVYSRPGYAAAGSAQYAGYGARAGGHQQYPHGGYAAPHGEAEAMEANQYNDAVGSGGYSSHHTQHGAQQQRQPAVYDTQHGAFMTGYDRMPRTAPGAAAMHQDGRPRMVVTAAVLREQLGGGIRAAVSEVISNASAAGVNARQARWAGGFAADDDQALPAEGSGANNTVTARRAAVQGADAAAAMAAAAAAALSEDPAAASAMRPTSSSPTVTVGNSRWTGRHSLDGAATADGEEWLGNAHTVTGTGEPGLRAPVRVGDGTAAAGASPGKWRLPPLRGLRFPRAGETGAEAPEPTPKRCDDATDRAEGSLAPAARGAARGIDGGGCSQSSLQQAQPQTSARQGVKRPLFAEQQRAQPPTAAAAASNAAGAAAAQPRPAKSALKHPSSMFHPIQAEVRPTAPPPLPQQQSAASQQAAPHPLRQPARAQPCAQVHGGSTKLGAAVAGLSMQPPPQRPAAPAASHADDPSQQTSGPAPKRARKVTFDMSGLGQEQHPPDSRPQHQPEAGSANGVVRRHPAPSPLPPSPLPDVHHVPLPPRTRDPQFSAPAAGAGPAAADRSTQATAERRAPAAPALLHRQGATAASGVGGKLAGVAAGAGGAGGVLELFDGDPYLLARERR